MNNIPFFVSGAIFGINVYNMHKSSIYDSKNSTKLKLIGISAFKGCVYGEFYLLSIPYMIYTKYNKHENFHQKHFIPLSKFIFSTYT